MESRNKTDSTIRRNSVKGVEVLGATISLIFKALELTLKFFAKTHILWDLGKSFRIFNQLERLLSTV